MYRIYLIFIVCGLWVAMAMSMRGSPKPTPFSAGLVVVFTMCAVVASYFVLAP
jgi:hypothetical protein